MERLEKKGLFKGIGIATILCAGIFYTMVLTMRLDYEDQMISDDLVIERAKELGMVHMTASDLNEGLSDEYIIERAKGLGMVEAERED